MAKIYISQSVGHLVFCANFEHLGHLQGFNQNYFLPGGHLGCLPMGKIV